MKLPMPFARWYTYDDHSGVDFPQSGGTPIYASGPGAVARHSTSPAGGHWIVIRYDGIGEVGYAHMNDWRGCPPVGSRVHEGTLIGYVGWDGHVVPAGRAGAHVHVAKISNQTYAATMALFDTTRVVGQGKPAGGNGKPINTKPATPEKEDEDMARNVIYKTTDPKYKLRAAVTNDVSGLWIEFVDNQAGTMNTLADRYETGDAITVTPSMFAAAREAAASIRPRGEINVLIGEPDA